MAHGRKFAKLKSTTNQQKFSRNVKQFLNYLQVHSIIHILLLLLLLLFLARVHNKEKRVSNSPMYTYWMSA